MTLLRKFIEECCWDPTIIEGAIKSPVFLEHRFKSVFKLIGGYSDSLSMTQRRFFERTIREDLDVVGIGSSLGGFLEIGSDVLGLDLPRRREMNEVFQAGRQHWLSSFARAIRNGIENSIGLEIDGIEGVSSGGHVLSNAVSIFLTSSSIIARDEYMEVRVIVSLSVMGESNERCIDDDILQNVVPLRVRNCKSKT